MPCKGGAQLHVRPSSSVGESSVGSSWSRTGLAVPAPAATQGKARIDPGPPAPSVPLGESERGHLACVHEFFSTKYL